MIYLQRNFKFQYEMPRPPLSDRPQFPRTPSEYLKRVWGELRSVGDKHELSINVRDADLLRGEIDRHWLTTDQCVKLDVTFKMTLADSASMSATDFVVPITAIDGTAGVRVPLTLAQASPPIDLRVTQVEVRPCSGSTAAQPTVTQCPTVSTNDWNFSVCARY